MKSTSDIFNELLVIQCQEGKKKAFDILVKKWNQKVLKQAYWYCKDGLAAKDIAQETWISAVKGLNRLNDPARFGVWLNRIIYHKAADWIRKQQKERGLDQLEIEQELHPGNTDRSERDEKIEKVLSLLNGLPEEQKIVLTLFYLKKHNLHEISEILSVPVGTVKSRLFTAREHLKKQLKT